MSPKTLHLVRHAEGYHQITPDGDNIRDPDLTPYGIDVQCAHLREIFPSHAAVSLLCSSPMRRAIRTALTAFAPEVTRGMRIRALPDAQEARNVASDTGVGAEELRKTFADDVVDYALVTGDWYHKSGPYATDMASLQARARRLRRYLRDDCEGEEVVLVTHGLFAHYLTGNIDESGRQTGSYWINVRWRSFNFLGGDADEEALLTETEESKSRADEGAAPEHPTKQQQ